jgi:hypothetical protein
MPEADTLDADDEDSLDAQIAARMEALRFTGKF